MFGVRLPAATEEVVEAGVRPQPLGRRALQRGQREVVRVDVDGVDARPSAHHGDAAAALVIPRTDDDSSRPR